MFKSIAISSRGEMAAAGPFDSRTVNSRAISRSRSRLIIRENTKQMMSLVSVSRDRRTSVLGSDELGYCAAGGCHRGSLVSSMRMGILSSLRRWRVSARRGNDKAGVVVTG